MTTFPKTSNSETLAGPGAIDLKRNLTDATGYRAYPKAVKRSLSVISSAASLHNSQIQLGGIKGPDEYMSIVSIFGGEPPSLQARVLFEAIANTYDWTITKANCEAFATECRELLAKSQDVDSGVLTVEDTRQTSDERAEQQAARDKQRTEREAKEKKVADAQAVVADKIRATIDADLVDQLPADMPRGDVAGCEGVSVPLFANDSEGFQATDLWPYGALSKDGDSNRDVIKLIRARVLDAQRQGLIMPCKISIRLEHYTSVDITITATAGDWKNPEYDDINGHPGVPVYLQPSRYLPEVQSAIDAMKAIARLYHWDLSDSMTDYFNSRFYCDVGIHYQCNEKAWTPAKWMLSGTKSASTGAAVSVEVDADGFAVEIHTHTKKDRDMALVTMRDRTERDEYQRRLAKAKELGGWYSRAWGQTPAGFAFWCDDEGEAKAAEFIAWIAA